MHHSLKQGLITPKMQELEPKIKLWHHRDLSVDGAIQLLWRNCAMKAYDTFINDYVTKGAIVNFVYLGYDYQSKAYSPFFLSTQN